MRGVPFDRRVEALLADHDDVAAIVRPMLTAWRQLREQIAVFDKAVRTLAKNDPTCRLLMSVPGIGVVTVLAYVSTVEDPARFARSRSVGAHIGLTPRQYQSGEVDRSGRISRCGDTLARTLMYEAAVVILSRVKKGFGSEGLGTSDCTASVNGLAPVPERPDSHSDGPVGRLAPQGSWCGLTRTPIDRQCLSPDLSTARERLAVRFSPRRCL